MEGIKGKVGKKEVDGWDEEEVKGIWRVNKVVVRF